MWERLDAAYVASQATPTRPGAEWFTTAEYAAHVHLTMSGARRRMQEMRRMGGIETRKVGGMTYHRLVEDK